MRLIILIIVVYIYIIDILVFILVGDNNGTLGARQYFECPPGHGLFTTANKIRFKRLQRR